MIAPTLLKAILKFCTTNKLFKKKRENKTCSKNVLKKQLNNFTCNWCKIRVKLVFETRTQVTRQFSHFDTCFTRPHVYGEYPVSCFWFSHWTSSFTKSYLRSTLWWQQIFYSCPRPLIFSSICSWSYFHQNFQPRPLPTKRIRIQLKDCTLKTLSHWSFFQPITSRLFPIKIRLFFCALDSDDSFWQLSDKKFRRYEHFNQGNFTTSASFFEAMYRN